MKKCLEPVYNLVENEFFDYMKKYTVIKIDDIFNAMENAIWLAPDYKICYGDISTRNGMVIIISLCHRYSGRSVRGGCQVKIKRQYGYNNRHSGTIVGIRVHGKEYNAASKGIN